MLGSGWDDMYQRNIALWLVMHAIARDIPLDRLHPKVLPAWSPGWVKVVLHIHL